MSVSTRQVVDRDTGELIAESTAVTIPQSDEPEYVKLYVRAWLVFKDIKGVNSDFLVHLLPYMSYANLGQRIFLTPPLKKEIASALGWKEKSALNRFNQELRKLVRYGILSRDGESTYTVNPELVGRGSWADIKQLRATFHVIGPKAGTVEPKVNDEVEPEASPEEARDKE